MNRFLRSTSFLDYHHPEILKLAQALKPEAKDPRQATKKIFYFVRDQIYYNPYVPFEQPENYQASRVLARGQGFCIPKAALAAALLRCLGLPSKLYFADITNHKAPERFRQMMDNLFVCHCYVGVEIEGRWLKLAPTFNQEMFSAVKVAANDFDGYNDALLPANALDGSRFVEYVRDRGERDDIPFAEIMTTFDQVYGRDVLAQWRSFCSEPRKRQ